MVTKYYHAFISRDWSDPESYDPTWLWDEKFLTLSEAAEAAQTALNKVMKSTVCTHGFLVSIIGVSRRGKETFVRTVRTSQSANIESLFTSP